MRIRQIVPGFWGDVVMQKQLSCGERLFYVGLWMLADDAGWFRSDVEEITAEVFRYEPVDAREAAATEMLEHLSKLNRIELVACGRHGRIPALPVYQRISEAKKSFKVLREHEERCADPGKPRGSDTGPGEPASSHGGPSRNETERDGRETNSKALDPNSLDGVSDLITARWGWQRVSAKQREAILEMADRRAVGSDGFKRLRMILEASDAEDPFQLLLSLDRQLKETGRRSAHHQEAESARRRSALPRGRASLESLGALLSGPPHDQSGPPRDQGFDKQETSAEEAQHARVATVDERSVAR